MQGCSYSRIERFLAVEKPELLPLPREDFQMKRHALLTVAPNSFIQLGTERHHYSVPCRLIGNKVEVLFTATQVRVFHDGKCIATHIRSLRQGGYTWKKEHLPSQTQAYYEYSPQYFIDKGAKHGSAVEYVIRELFSVTDRPAEVYYRSAQGILALARETEPEIFLLACNVSIKYGKCNYQFINSLVKSKCQGYIALQEKGTLADSCTTVLHSNIRGADSFK